MVLLSWFSLDLTQTEMCYFPAFDDTSISKLVLKHGPRFIKQGHQNRCIFSMLKTYYGISRHYIELRPQCLSNTYCMLYMFSANLSSHFIPPKNKVLVEFGLESQILRCSGM